MKKQLILFATGLIWLGTLLFVFQRSPYWPAPDTAPQSITVSKDFCGVCTPEGTTYNPAIAHISNPNKHNFSCVLTATGKITDPPIPFFETSRIRFDAIRREHVVDIYDILSSPFSAPYTTYPTAHSMQDAYDFCEKMEYGYKIGDTVPFGIFDKASGELIGIGGYVTFAPDEKIDHPKFKISGGRSMAMISLKQKMLGKGIEEEAYKALIEYGITHKIFMFRRVETHIAVEDEAKIRAAENAGMVREGTLKDRYLVDGKPTSFHAYAIIRTDITDELKKSVQA